MRLFYKEKLDDKRIIHICGFRFEYRIVPIIKKTGIESAPPHFNNISNIFSSENFNFAYNNQFFIMPNKKTKYDNFTII